MENKIKKLLREGSNPILLYNLGKNNQIFQLIRVLNDMEIKTYVCHDLGEYIIEHLYMKKSLTDEVVCDETKIFLIRGVDNATNKPTHIRELKDFISDLIKNNIILISTCHDKIPDDVRCAFEDYNTRFVNMNGDNSK